METVNTKLLKMTPSKLISILMYLVTVACLIFAAHRAVHRRWREYERHRTTLGVMCVLLPAPLMTTLSGLQMWGSVLAGFGVAGAVTVAADTEHQLTAVQKALKELEANH